MFRATLIVWGQAARVALMFRWERTARGRPLPPIADEAPKRFTLLESEDRVGGLARTEVVDGFSFDFTGHWFHARDPQVRKLVAERFRALVASEADQR